jgi:hypothetical protein
MADPNDLFSDSPPPWWLKDDNDDEEDDGIGHVSSKLSTVTIGEPVQCSPLEQSDAVAYRSPVSAKTDVSTTKNYSEDLSEASWQFKDAVVDQLGICPFSGLMMERI